MQSDEKDILRLLADHATRRQAFGIIVDRYSEPLYRQIRRIVLTHDNANDVLQNTMMKAWQSLDTFEGRSKISSWLYRIAVNEALAFRRRPGPMSEPLTTEDGELDVVDTLMADEYFDGDEAAAKLQAAIDGLPHVQRTVFQMRYFENIPYKEISEILNTSEGALKASYHIAVGKISDYLNNQD